LPIREDFARERRQGGVMSGRTTAICDQIKGTVPTEFELDIMKEKAEALGRTGRRLEECLNRLRFLEKKVGTMRQRGTWVSGVNAVIEEYNRVREDAVRFLKYLVIHREALGFRRHTVLEEMYAIPDRKPLLGGDDVR